MGYKFKFLKQQLTMNLGKNGDDSLKRGKLKMTEVEKNEMF